jgi:hypothetical protein
VQQKQLEDTTTVNILSSQHGVQRESCQRLLLSFLSPSRVPSYLNSSLPSFHPSLSYFFSSHPTRFPTWTHSIVNSVITTLPTLSARWTILKTITPIFLQLLALLTSASSSPSVTLPENSFRATSYSSAKSVLHTLLSSSLTTYGTLHLLSYNPVKNQDAPRKERRTEILVTVF